MPLSKRAQKVTLSKTQKKGRARKESLVDEVRECADAYAAAYVVDAQNMRNSALKEVRRLLAGSSRLFFAAAFCEAMRSLRTAAKSRP